MNLVFKRKKKRGPQYTYMKSGGHVGRSTSDQELWGQRTPHTLPFLPQCLNQNAQQQGNHPAREAPPPAKKPWRQHRPQQGVDTWGKPYEAGTAHQEGSVD